MASFPGNPCKRGASRSSSRRTGVRLAGIRGEQALIPYIFIQICVTPITKGSTCSLNICMNDPKPVGHHMLNFIFSARRFRISFSAGKFLGPLTFRIWGAGP